MPDERDILLPEDFLWVRSPAHAPNGTVTCAKCHSSTAAPHKGGERVQTFIRFHQELHA